MLRWVVRRPSSWQLANGFRLHRIKKRLASHETEVHGVANTGRPTGDEMYEREAEKWHSTWQNQRRIMNCELAHCSIFRMGAHYTFAKASTPSGTSTHLWREGLLRRQSLGKEGD